MKTKTRAATSPKPAVSKAERRRRKRASRPALTPDESRRLRNKIGAVTCSAAWEDEAVREADAQGIVVKARTSGDDVADLLEEFEIYPPPPDIVPGRPRHVVRMKRCNLCGKKVPPQYTATLNLHGIFVRICADCAIQPSLRSAQETLSVERLLRERAVYKELKSIKLNDAEIAAMALWWEGCTQRQIGHWLEKSQSFIRLLLKSGMDKVRRAGLALPPRPEAPTGRRTVRTDPAILDQLPAA